MRPVILLALAALAAAVPLDTEHVARARPPINIQDTRSVERHRERGWRDWWDQLGEQLAEMSERMRIIAEQQAATSKPRRA